jgi:hypothetical protein
MESLVEGPGRGMKMSFLLCHTIPMICLIVDNPAPKQQIRYLTFQLFDFPTHECLLRIIPSTEFDESRKMMAGRI